MQRIVDVGNEKVQTCQERTRQQTFTDDNMKFYVKVIKPIATAMDLHQGKEDCYIGHVIPTIKGIQHKLKLLTDDCDTVSSN